MKHSSSSSHCVNSQTHSVAAVQSPVINPFSLPMPIARDHYIKQYDEWYSNGTLAVVGGRSAERLGKNGTLSSPFLAVPPVKGQCMNSIYNRSSSHSNC